MPLSRNQRKHGELPARSPVAAMISEFRNESASIFRTFSPCFQDEKFCGKKIKMRKKEAPYRVCFATCATLRTLRQVIDAFLLWRPSSLHFDNSDIKGRVRRSRRFCSCGIGNSFQESSVQCFSSLLYRVTSTAWCTVVNGKWKRAKHSHIKQQHRLYPIKNTKGNINFRFLNI